MKTIRMTNTRLNLHTTRITPDSESHENQTKIEVTPIAQTSFIHTKYYIANWNTNYSTGLTYVPKKDLLLLSSVLVKEKFG